MQLGFVSAILPDYSLEGVFSTASKIGFDCIELMCWPIGKAERRYAGVTHLDVVNCDEASIDQMASLTDRYGVAVSGLGYYPNPLSADSEESAQAIRHIEDVIKAASRLGIGQVNTFVGRNPVLSIDDNWGLFLERWVPLVNLAEEYGIRIGIENCPMFFSKDEWPGGKNLAISPAIWRRMFNAIPSSNFGLNYDPSHLIWQHMDCVSPLREFADRLFHVHAKDVRIDKSQLDSVGILANPLEYHSPKLPGLGDVDWGSFFSVLGDTGYRGPVCVEVEDRAYEASDQSRELALQQSYTFLRNFIPRLPQDD